MLFEEFKELLFTKALNSGFEECEIYFSNRESIGISIYEQELEKYNINTTFGLSFRGEIQGKIGYSYTEILDEEAIDLLIRNAIDGAKTIENEDIQFIYEGDKEYQEVQCYTSKLENLKPEKLIEFGLKIEEESKKYSEKVVNIGGCSIAYGNYKQGIYNTKGLELVNKSNILTAYVIPIVEDGNEKYDGTGYVRALSIEDIKPKDIAKQGVEEALSRIGGRSIPSGKYKAILYNEAMVSLLGTFSGIFDADAAQKGLSLLKGKEGEKISSNKVTIVDDPLLDNGFASTSFDDEGVATYKKELVAKGELKTLLYNLKTAYKAGCKSTGNGFKSSYASPVSISPTNLYIQKGKKTLKELIEEIGEGVLITDLAGLHSGANAITGDFSLAAKGFYIENGKKSYPIEQITIAGNYFTILKEIEEVGSDLKFPMSSVGSPSIKIKEISIAGK